MDTKLVTKKAATIPLDNLGSLQWPVMKSHVISAASILLIMVMLCLALWKFWIVSRFPIILNLNSAHDGLWFFRRAFAMYQGVWMGETYDHHTIMKGPGFSVYLYLNAKLGLNPRFTTDVFYIVSCFVAYGGMVRLGMYRIAALLGFALLLLNPITLSYAWQHVLRFTFYLPLVLCFISAAVVLTSDALGDKGVIPSKAYALLAGCSFALMWITREETIWALPVLVLVSGALVYRGYFGNKMGMVVTLLLLFMPVLITNHWVSSKNEEHYAWYGIAELKEPNFSRAWKAVQSLNTRPSDGYDFSGESTPAELSITAETAEKLRQISPNTKQLVQTMFDDGGGETNVPGFNYKVNATYGYWLLRDSVQKLGYYKDSATARNYYHDLAEDIEQYCSKNNGSCTPMYSSMVFWREGHLQKSINAIPYVWGELVGISKDYEPKQSHDGEFFGDYSFKYRVGRFFNARMQWDEELEKINNPIGVDDLKKYRRAQSNYESYQQQFSGLFIVSLIALIGYLIFFGSFQYWAAFMVIGGALSAIFLINLLLAVTAYAEIARPLAAASAPMYMLSALGIDALIRLITEGYKRIRLGSLRSTLNEG